MADDDVPESARLPPEDEAAEGGETGGETSSVKKKASPKKSSRVDGDGETDQAKPRNVGHGRVRDS